MMKVAYLDCPTGLAGDMCLGALVDAGVPLGYIEGYLKPLGLDGECQLAQESVYHNGQRATKVHVHLIGTASHSSHDSAPESSKDPALPLDQARTFNSVPDSASNSAPDSASNHASAHGHHHHTGHHHFHDHQHAHVQEHSYTPESGRHRSGTVKERHLPEIEQLIRAAQLPPRAERWSLTIFRQLAAAEGAVHGIAPEQVHFHEVGATDAIVDIVGTCLGLDWLGIEKLYCSPLPTGGGTVWAAHGRLPVPVPAVLKLYEMRRVPIYSNGIQRELVTPTGAAIATSLAAEFGPPPAMTLIKIGLGAGTLELPLPNIVRLWIGEETSPAQPVSRQHTHPAPGAHQHQDTSETMTAEETRHQHSYESSRSDPTPAPAHAENPHAAEQEQVTLLETQIDDLSPQAIGYVFDALFQAGALDVFTQPVGMKKNRPGVLLTVVCTPDQVAECETILFRETTTLGIRRCQQERTALFREFETIQLSSGPVRIKIARTAPDAPILNIQPEYEDCAQIARQLNRPWRDVHQAALQQWYQVHGVEPSNVSKPIIPLQSLSDKGIPS